MASLVLFSVSLPSVLGDVTVVSIAGFVTETFSLAYTTKSGPISLSPEPKKLPLFHLQQPQGLAKLRKGDEWQIQHLARLPHDGKLSCSTLEGSKTGLRVRHQIGVEVKYCLDGAKTDLVLRMGKKVTIASVRLLVRRGALGETYINLYPSSKVPLPSRLIPPPSIRRPKPSCSSASRRQGELPVLHLARESHRRATSKLTSTHTPVEKEQRRPLARRENSGDGSLGVCLALGKSCVALIGFAVGRIYIVLPALSSICNWWRGLQPVRRQLGLLFAAGAAHFLETFLQDSNSSPTR